MYVPPEIRKCVAFVSYVSRATGSEVCGGTAFLVTLDGHLLWVTAKHVIVACAERGRDQLVRLRVNTTEGPPEAIDSSVGDWWTHPDDPSVDVVVLPEQGRKAHWDVIAIPMRMQVGSAVSFLGRAGYVAVGDELFFPGLFAPHSIKGDRNIPIVRTGTIAALPEGRCIKSKKLGLIEGYLVESRSIGGVSGSPVFVYLGPPDWDNMTVAEKWRKPSFWLLGLVHGHWDDGDSGLAEYDAWGNDRRDVVNMGIAVVVPVEQILQVANHPDLTSTRSAAGEDEAATLPDSAFVEAVQQYTRSRKPPPEQGS